MWYTVFMDEKENTFEGALSELETLVASMESGAMGLEDMVSAFEKGQKLVADCGRRLDEIEKRVEAIRSAPDGKASEEEDKKIPFEKAIEELTTLVDAMEKGKMGLEEMVSAYGEGQRLATTCGRRLNEIEQRIEVIRRKPDGTAGTVPLPAQEEP